MNIVMIHGQSHEGISCHMGRMLVDQLNPDQLQEFFLPRDMPYFCMGCYCCMKEDITHCPHWHAMEGILDAIHTADVLIFTTPVYCLRTSGSMKAFLDHCFIYWMIHRPQCENFYKRAIILSSGAGAGMKTAIKDIKTSLTYWGISDIQSYGVAAKAMSWEMINTAVEKKIKRHIQKIARKKATHRISLKTRCIFLMMRGMQKVGWGACEKDMIYWKEQGWLGNQRPWDN